MQPMAAPEVRPSVSNRLITLNDVKELTGLSTSAIYAGTGEGWFPAGRKVGKRSVRWLEAEVQEWISQLPQVRYAACRQGN